jgi:predicted class III extradiol MEMO1 family dioxygenase
MIKVELTEREFECLLGHMEVDEEIFEEIVETEPSDDPNDYTNVMLSLIKKFREIKNTSI